MSNIEILSNVDLLNRRIDGLLWTKFDHIDMLSMSILTNNYHWDRHKMNHSSIDLQCK